MRDAGSGAALPLPAYNSVGQFRADAWNSLADATGRLRKAAGEAERARLARQAEEVLALLDPIEHYWAFPRRHQLLDLRELLVRGEYDQLRKLAASITRTLAQDTHRTSLPAGGDHEPGEQAGARGGAGPAQVEVRGGGGMPPGGGGGRRRGGRQVARAEGRV